tara:strand:- start:2262 stop:2441 length:180 start_codon:yes stop_codon:yes gene_type:complete
MSITKSHAYKYGELKVAAEAAAYAILNFKHLTEFEIKFLESRAQSVLDLIKEQDERGTA